MTMTNPKLEFLNKVRDLVLPRVPEECRIRVQTIPIIYNPNYPTPLDIIFNPEFAFGMGRTGADANECPHVIEIMAQADSGPISLAVTLIHELAHVISLPSAVTVDGNDHGELWRRAAMRLGLHNPQQYGMSCDLDPELRAQILALEYPA